MADQGNAPAPSMRPAYQSPASQPAGQRGRLTCFLSSRASKNKKTKDMHFTERINVTFFGIRRSRALVAPLARRRIKLEAKGKVRPHNKIARRLPAGSGDLASVPSHAGSSYGQGQPAFAEKVRKGFSYVAEPKIFFYLCMAEPKTHSFFIS